MITTITVNAAPESASFLDEKGISFTNNGDGTLTLPAMDTKELVLLAEEFEEFTRKTSWGEVANGSK